MRAGSMPRGWIRAQRAAAVFRAGGEAAEIAAVEARRQHLAGGLARLVGATAAALLTDDDFAPGRRGRIAAVAAAGNVVPIARAHVERENEFNPALRRLLRIVHDGPGDTLFVHPRGELASDRAWRESALYNDYYRPARIDETLYAARRVGPARVHGGVLARAPRERPFDEEDRSVVALFLETFGKLWAPPSEAFLVALPPRLRRVCDLLLLGLSEKEVADRAGLTPASTHQYVVEIYRRARVSSRAQLMARLLRPGPTVP